jgi:catechol 2,3-dioxygenase-like lactoylglutathione lyase family enzyme
MQVLVNIDVDVLARAAAFYVAALGLRPGRRLGADVLELLGAGAPLYLLRRAPGTAPSRFTAQRRHYRRHWSPVHLDFVVADIEAAERFYCAMGLKVVNRRKGDHPEPETSQEQTYLSASGDASTHQLILCRFYKLPPPKRPVYPGEAWGVLYVADVDAACRTAETAGGGVFRAGPGAAARGGRTAAWRRAALSPAPGGFRWRSRRSRAR